MCWAAQVLALPNIHVPCFSENEMQRGEAPNIHAATELRALHSRGLAQLMSTVFQPPSLDGCTLCEKELYSP